MDRGLARLNPGQVEVAKIVKAEPTSPLSLLPLGNKSYRKFFNSFAESISILNEPDRTYVCHSRCTGEDRPRKEVNTISKMSHKQ